MNFTTNELYRITWCSLSGIKGEASSLAVENPSTGEVIAQTPQETGQAVETAQAAFASWSRTPVASLPFGGLKASEWADIKAQGKSVIDFFTEQKIVTERYWPEA